MIGIVIIIIKEVFESAVVELLLDGVKKTWSWSVKYIRPKKHIQRRERRKEGNDLNVFGY
jgi:hypothetical protein